MASTARASGDPSRFHKYTRSRTILTRASPDSSIHKLKRAFSPKYLDWLGGGGVEDVWDGVEDVWDGVERVLGAVERVLGAVERVWGAVERVWGGVEDVWDGVERVWGAVEDVLGIVEDVCERPVFKS